MRLLALVGFVVRAGATPAHALATVDARFFHAFLQCAERTERDGATVRTFRGRFHSPARTTDYRVLCLGSSTTWGYGTQPDEAWPLQLEHRLQQQGYDVEVINAGYPWYTTAHSLVNYALLLRHYDPDAVIIMHGVNDLMRSFPKPGECAFERDYGTYQGPLRKLFIRHGMAAADEPWSLGSLLRRSAIYRVLCDRTGFDRMYYKSLRPHTASRCARAGSDLDPGQLPSLHTFRENLDYLVRLCAADGCRVLLATQAHMYDTPEDSRQLPGNVTTVRQTLFRTPNGNVMSAQSAAATMQAIRAATLQVAGQDHVPVADVERAIASRIEYFVDDFHLSEKGNVAVADTIAGTLVPILDTLGHPASSPAPRDRADHP